MSYIFIELFNYADKWREASDAFRTEFTEQIIGAFSQMPGLGIEIVAWGFNDRDTDARAPYDFFCVYRVATREAQSGFEAMIRASGWFDYFEQVNVRGLARSGEDMLRANARLELPAVVE